MDRARIRKHFDKTENHLRIKYNIIVVLEYASLPILFLPPTPASSPPCSVAVGLALGAALRHVAPPWFRPHVVAATGLGNVGNLPLVLVAALVHEAGSNLGEVGFSNL